MDREEDNLWNAFGAGIIVGAIAVILVIITFAYLS